MLFFKHVVKTFKTRAFLVIALGIIMGLSSFLYTVMVDAVEAIEQPTEEYFEAYNQEDFTFDFIPYVLPSERLMFASECSGVFTETLSQLSQSNKTCFDAVVSYRLERLNENYAAHFDLRFYKDTYHELEERHRVRVLKSMEDINETYLVEGVLPTKDNEIAIISVYADHNNLALGDTLVIEGNDYTLTAFVLFPDYTLPVIDHMFLFDSFYQTLALMTDDAFLALDLPTEVAGAGVFLASDFDVSELLEDESVISATLTVHNLRSGAIYTELTASQAMALFMSILIAGIGIIITAILMAKTLEQNRQAIGILKALGLANKTIALPYLLFISIFSIVFLTIGYGLGFIAAEPLKTMFVTFYLLPNEAVSFRVETMLTAIGVPFIFLVSLSAIILRGLLKQPVVSLLSSGKEDQTKVRFKSLRQKMMRFNVKSRVQVAFITRHPVKVSVYIVGVFTALLLIFMSFSMMGMFERSVSDYYNTQTMESIGYCRLLEACETSGGEEVIELPVLINQKQVTLIAINPVNSHIHLPSSRNQELRDLLEDGIIITRSYQLLSDDKVGDNLTLTFMNETNNQEIVAVADLYPGDYIFMHIDTLRSWLEMDNFYNVVYSSTPLDEANYVSVLHVSELLNQVESMNEIVQWMVRIVLIAAMAMGAIIIYVLTVMLVEDYFYPIALFKVMGYNNADIHTMLLGGYSKLNIFTFLISVPIGFLMTHGFTMFFAYMFDFAIPMTLYWWHILLTFGLLIFMYTVGSAIAKRKINRVSLQEALKRYQD